MKTRKPYKPRKTLMDIGTIVTLGGYPWEVIARRKAPEKGTYKIVGMYKLLNVWTSKTLELTERQIREGSMKLSESYYYSPIAQ